MLSQRGLECKGCTDKEDYIKMAFENQHLPILPPPATPEPVREKDDPLKKKEVDDVSIVFNNPCASAYPTSFIYYCARTVR